jgi:hypothetical protein
VLAELGMVSADSRHRRADRAGHTGSSALGCGCGSRIASAQAYRASELSHQEVALGVGLRLPPGVRQGACLLDVVFDVGEAAAVGSLGPLVEDLARVAEGRLVPCFSRDKVEHVEFAGGVRERRSCARYRMPLRSRTRTVRPSKTTDQ